MGGGGQGYTKNEPSLESRVCRVEGGASPVQWWAPVVPDPRNTRAQMLEASLAHGARLQLTKSNCKKAGAL